MKIQTSTIKASYSLNYSKKVNSFEQEFSLLFYGFYHLDKKKKVVAVLSRDLAKMLEDILQIESISFLESLPSKKNEVYDGVISRALIYEDEFRFVSEKLKKDYAQSEEKFILLYSLLSDITSCFEHFRHQVLQDFIFVESNIPSFYSFSLLNKQKTN